MSLDGADQSIDETLPVNCSTLPRQNLMVYLQRFSYDSYVIHWLIIFHQLATKLISFQSKLNRNILFILIPVQVECTIDASLLDCLNLKFTQTTTLWFLIHQSTNAPLLVKCHSNFNLTQVKFVLFQATPCLQNFLIYLVLGLHLYLVSD